MATTKKKSTSLTQKARRMKVGKVLFVVYNGLLILIVSALSLTIYRQQQALESMGLANFGTFVANSNESYYGSFSIDAPAQKAYAPQVALRFAYSQLASDVRYKVQDGVDESKTKLSLVFTERHNLTPRDMMSNTQCINQFAISIEESLPNGYSEASRKQLADGRTIVIGTSQDQACTDYVEGLTGKDFLKLLESVESY